MHTRAIFILERKEGEIGKQQERPRKRVCEYGSVAGRRTLVSVIKLTVGKNPLTSFWDKLERITIFWETILMEKWDRKDTLRLNIFSRMRLATIGALTCRTFSIQHFLLKLDGYHLRHFSSQLVKDMSLFF
jgi:hypothetical protein